MFIFHLVTNDKYFQRKKFLFSHVISTRPPRSSSLLADEMNNDLRQFPIFKPVWLLLLIAAAI